MAAQVRRTGKISREGGGLVYKKKCITKSVSFYDIITFVTIAVIVTATTNSDSKSIIISTTTTATAFTTITTTTTTAMTRQ